ncbi:MAG: hypothetical protein K2I00_02115 [Ruminococcus sp.]|nr:hypothetical protein [Ruminococcus sp.]
MFFDLQISLCERFPCLSPFDVRKQKFREVFLTVRRLNKKSSQNEKTTHFTKSGGKTRCYVPVSQEGDNGE